MLDLKQDNIYYTLIKEEDKDSYICFSFNFICVNDIVEPNHYVEIRRYDIVISNQKFLYPELDCPKSNFKISLYENEIFDSKEDVDKALRNIFIKDILK
jgi:hypothetical protein